MAARRRAESKVFSLAERKLLEPKKRTSGSRKPQRKDGWQSIALVCLLLLLLTTSVVALYAFHVVATLREDTDGMMAQVESRMQKLASAVRFDSKRQQMLLGIRDAIMEANPKIGLNQAYQYSDWILTASEKYPSLDPVMFLAIGLVESGYKSNAVSGANAQGLYQIWPSTGRMLARVRGWEYTEDMLFDPEKNTELAALYLDILFFCLQRRTTGPRRIQWRSFERRLLSGWHWSRRIRNSSVRRQSSRCLRRTEETVRARLL